MGAAGMSMRLRRGLRISCCPGIWFEEGVVNEGEREGEIWGRGEGGSGEETG